MAAFIGLNALSFLTMQFVMAIELSNSTLELTLLIGSLALCVLSGIPIFKNHWNNAQVEAANYLKSYRVAATLIFLFLFGGHILDHIRWLPSGFELLKWLTWVCLYILLTMPVFVHHLSSKDTTEGVFSTD